MLLYEGADDLELFITTAHVHQAMERHFCSFFPNEKSVLYKRKIHPICKTL